MSEARRELVARRLYLIDRGWVLAISPGHCVRCGARFEVDACVLPVKDE